MIGWQGSCGQSYNFTYALRLLNQRQRFIPTGHLYCYWFSSNHNLFLKSIKIIHCTTIRNSSNTLTLANVMFFWPPTGIWIVIGFVNLTFCNPDMLVVVDGKTFNVVVFKGIFTVCAFVNVWIVRSPENSQHEGPSQQKRSIKYLNIKNYLFQN